MRYNASMNNESLAIRICVWLWKLRFALRIWHRSRTCENARLYWHFCWESAEAGWANIFSDDTALSALDESPEDAADEEMSYWTSDEEPN